MIKKQKKHDLHCQIPQELFEAIEERCGLTNKSITAFVTEALTGYLNKQQRKEATDGR